jgi:hypothetical protein
MQDNTAQQTRKYSSASGGIQTGVHNTKADQLFKENSLNNGQRKGPVAASYTHLNTSSVP